MRFVFTPDWFLGKDVLIEGFSFIVLLIFAILAIRYFKLNKNRNFLYLGTGFGLIALAQLAAVFTKLVLYYDFGPSQQIGQAIIVTYQIVNSVDVFYYLGFLSHRLLTLLGLYVIYRLPRLHKSYGDYFLIGYFLVISTLVSKSFYYVYHLTALFLLAAIVLHYYEIYRKNNYQNTLVLLGAFGILALSQLIFLLSTIEMVFVFGNLVELTSYIILLVLIVRIMKHGKKKNKNGHNIRYVGHH